MKSYRRSTFASKSLLSSRKVKTKAVEKSTSLGRSREIDSRSRESATVARSKSKETEVSPKEKAIRSPLDVSRQFGVPSRVNAAQLPTKAQKTSASGLFFFHSLSSDLAFSKDEVMFYSLVDCGGLPSALGVAARFHWDVDKALDELLRLAQKELQNKAKSRDHRVLGGVR